MRVPIRYNIPYAISAFGQEQISIESFAPSQFPRISGPWVAFFSAQSITIVEEKPRHQYVRGDITALSLYVAWSLF